MHGIQERETLVFFSFKICKPFRFLYMVSWRLVESISGGSVVCFQKQGDAANATIQKAFPSDGCRLLPSITFLLALCDRPRGRSSRKYISGS